MFSESLGAPAETRKEQNEPKPTIFIDGEAGTTGRFAVVRDRLESPDSMLELGFHGA
jgi:hypothetical protein